jgi:hypothetical protein
VASSAIDHPSSSSSSALINTILTMFLLLLFCLRAGGVAAGEEAHAHGPPGAHDVQQQHGRDLVPVSGACHVNVTVSAHECDVNVTVSAPEYDIDVEKETPRGGLLR